MRLSLLVAIINLGGCVSTDTPKDFTKYTLNRDNTITASQYINGRLASVINYLSDTQTYNGSAYYYLNDQLLRQEYWENGKRVGSYTEYKDGIPYRYICYDSYGDTIFLRKFDGRQIIEEKGKILPHGMLVLDQLTQDSLAIYSGFFVKPPYVAFDIECFAVNELDRDTMLPYKTEIAYDWAHYYYFRFERPGNYLLKRVVKIVDSLRDMNRMIIATDTTQFLF
jgi:hypothetical protein